MPTITVIITIVIVVYVIADIHVVVVVYVRTAIPPVVVVRVTIVRMPVKAVVVRVQVMRIPADGIRSGYAPEVAVMKVVVERIVRRVRIVVHRVWLRIIVVNRLRLIDDDLLRLVVGHVYDVFLNRCNLNSAFLVRDELVVVTL